MGKRDGKIPNYKGPKKSTKLKRWKKGQSSLVNPSSNTHRLAVKSRGFVVNTGPSKLTLKAVEEHETVHAERDDDLPMESDAMSIGGRTAKTSLTWATNFTNCTNVSFNKLLNRYSTSKLDAHKQVFAALAATAEVIRSQGGSETDTEYFALLMSSLESMQQTDEEALAAAAYLLSIVIKKVPVAVLKSRFSDSVKVLLGILGSHANTNVPSLLRSVIVSLAHILRVQDLGRWSEEETKHAYQSILSTVISSKAKVRKAAQLAVRAILHGSTFMTTAGAPVNHPAASQTAKYCAERLNESGVGNNATTTTLHVMELLCSILGIFPKNGLKKICDSILKVMLLSDAMLLRVAMKTWNNMFILKPSINNLPVEQNGQIITALHDFKPNESDTQAMQLWLSTMTHAHCNLARIDAQLCLEHLPRLFTTAMKCLQVVNLSQAAATDINTLITECIGSATDLAVKMVVGAPVGASTPIHKLFRQVEGGLSYQYCAVWDVVLRVISSFFEVLGKECHCIMRKCVKSLADLRDSPHFQHKELLDRTIGMAIKRMGPKVVLEIVPLMITGEENDNFERSWLLPVLRNHIEETEMSFFTSYFLPLAQRLEKKSLMYKEQKQDAKYKTYKTLYNQIWALFPGFCTNPTDFLTAFTPAVGKTLRDVITEKPDCRLDVLNALRKLVNQNLNGVENEEQLVKQKQLVVRCASNFLPVLFNQYVLQTEDTKDKDTTFLAVLETIKVCLKLVDQTCIEKYANGCHTNLLDEQHPLIQKYLLMDIVICLVPYLDAAWLNKYVTMALNELKSDDKTRQKKSYRILEEICSMKSDTCRSVVSQQLTAIQDLLIKNLSTSNPSSKAPRLRCIQHLLLQSDQRDVSLTLIRSVIPEVILCTKASGEKARLAAFALLTQMTNAYLMLRSDTDPKEALCEYVGMLIAGLAGNNSHLISCTVLALTKIIFNFKGQIGLEVVSCLVDSCCLLLPSASREIVQSALGLVKALLSAFGETIFGQFLKKVVSALVAINAATRLHFRNKIKELYSRLTRKFGFELVLELVPVSQHKMLNHMRKMQDRATRKKSAGKKEEEEEDVDEDEKPKHNADSIDDLLRDTDSEMEDDAKEASNKKNKTSKKKDTWLKEGDDIIDFLDPSIATKFTSTKPLSKAAAAKKQQPIKHDYKTMPDGRLAITVLDEDDKKSVKGFKSKKQQQEEEDLDDLFDDIEDGLPAKYRKRKREADADENDDGKRMKYKAGGSGIHRVMKGKQPSSEEIGKEYKSKRAAGDMKKPGKLDPHAYFPLEFQNLNKRKKAKASGQFKNLMNGARKGAQKGAQKQSKKRGGRK